MMSCGGAMHRKCIWRIMCIDSLPEWSKGVATSASCAGSNPTAVIFPRSLISNATTLMPNSFNAGQCLLPDSQPTRGVELGHHLGRRPHYNTIWGGGLITMLRQPRPEPSARLPPLALLIFGRLSQSKHLVCRDTATQVALC